VPEPNPAPVRAPRRDILKTMPELLKSGPETALQSVPMLDFSREYGAIRAEILAAITEVCDTQKFILGPAVERFEKAAAEACGVPYALGCASGTDAIWLALAALKIGAGDKVVTTPFSFFASVSAILRSGATPVLADIDERTFNLSADAVAGIVAREKIAAIMPVHLYGQCAEMDKFQALGAEHGCKLVEDAAQAFGASWLGKSAGSLGDAAAFSFYPTKNLSAYGEAGLVTTASAEVTERTTMLRSHGMRRRYYHDELGWNARMDGFQGAVLEIKLRRLAAGNERRRAIAALYGKLFAAVGLVGKTTADGLVLPFVDPRGTHIYHQYVIRASRRDALRDFLSSHKISSEIYYPLPLHLQESLKFLGYKPGDFPVAERAAQEVLALPIYPELRDDEAETVVEAIRRFYA
jgi:dTDP-4-amino-4,6-dideoxygalactose transaminase